MARSGSPRSRGLAAAVRRAVGSAARRPVRAGHDLARRARRAARRHPRGAEAQLPRAGERARGGRARALERRRGRAAARGRRASAGAARRAPRSGPQAERACPTRRWPTRSRPACCGACGRRRPRRTAPFIRLDEVVETWAADDGAPAADPAAARRPRRRPRPRAAAEPRRGRVLHQDSHTGNMLLDEHRGWLAIDPKPLVGERAFDCAALVRDRRTELMRDPASARPHPPAARPALRGARARPRADPRLGGRARRRVGRRDRHGLGPGDGRLRGLARGGLGQRRRCAWP